MQKQKYQSATKKSNRNAFLADGRVILNFIHIDCIRNYAIHKALITQHDQFDLKSDFWRVASNTTRDFSVIQWCKLFGNWSETTHWKNHFYIKDFENEILIHTNISKSDWIEIHKEILEYRNKNAAHIDINNWKRNIPRMNSAIEILYRSFERFISPSFGGWSLRDEYKKVYDETLSAVSTSKIK